MVLGGGADFVFDSQMGEVGIDVVFGEVAGMGEFVEVEKFFDPEGVGLDSSFAVVAGLEGVDELVEEFGLGRSGSGFGCVG